MAEIGSFCGAKLSGAVASAAGDLLLDACFLFFLTEERGGMNLEEDWPLLGVAAGESSSGNGAEILPPL